MVLFIKDRATDPSFKSDRKFMHYSKKLGVAAFCGLLSTSVYAGPLQLLYEVGNSTPGANDQYGYRVAIDGDMFAVSSVFDDDRGTDSGSVFLYDAASGTQLHQLNASNARSGDNFGFGLDFDNGTVVVGARLNDTRSTNAGAAYLFDAATGVQTQILHANDASSSDEFGWSVAIDGDVVAVGARLDDDLGNNSGSVYLFDANTGAQTNKLTAADGGQSAQFGWDVALDGDQLVVGASLANSNGSRSGSAYLFDVSTGVQTSQIVGSDTGSDDRFGFSVDIEGGDIVVGSVLDDDNGTNAGAAYTFDSSFNENKLLALDGQTNDLFGYSVAISDSYTAIGAIRGEGGAADSGTVYLFDNVSGLQLDQIDFGTLVNFQDQIGFSVDLTDDYLIVGARLDDTVTSNAGKVYVYGIQPVPSPGMLGVFALGLLLRLSRKR